jgi:hypothetical protein
MWERHGRQRKSPKQGVLRAFVHANILAGLADAKLDWGSPIQIMIERIKSSLQLRHLTSRVS